MLVPAALDGAAPPGETLIRGCSLESKLATQVFELIKSRSPRAQPIQALGEAGPEDNVVRLTFVSLTVTHEARGSVATVRTEILRNGSVAIVQTVSRKSLFPGETCDVMERITNAVARDIVARLPAGLMAQQPSDAPK